MPEDDEDPPCECVYIDVDLVDERYCPLHGPRGPIERAAREREAAEEAAYWSHPGWKEVFGE